MKPLCTPAVLAILMPAAAFARAECADWIATPLFWGKSFETAAMGMVHGAGPLWEGGR